MEVYVIEEDEYDCYGNEGIADSLETALAMIRGPYDRDKHYAVTWDEPLEEKIGDGWTLRGHFGTGGILDRAHSYLVDHPANRADWRAMTLPSERLSTFLYRLAGRIYVLARRIEPKTLCDCGCSLYTDECEAVMAQQNEMDRIIGSYEDAAAREAYRDAESEFGR